MKYVIIDETLPICFNECIPHISFKNLGNITSAGFVKIDKERKICAYGKSETLKLSSKKEDALVLELLLNCEDIWH